MAGPKIVVTDLDFFFHFHSLQYENNELLTQALKAFMNVSSHLSNAGVTQTTMETNSLYIGGPVSFLSTF